MLLRLNDGMRELASSGSTVSVPYQAAFLTVEHPPVSVGGLSVVSGTLPQAINRTFDDWQMSVLQPGLAPWCRQYASKFAELNTAARVKDDNDETGFLWQESLADDGQTPLWTLNHPELFAPHPHLYFDHRFHPQGSSRRWLGSSWRQALFRSNMQFVIQAAAWMKDAALRMDLIFANDWLTAPVLYEYDRPAARVMMLHNTYDEPRSVQEARRVGLRIPPYAREIYSPLTIGLKESHIVIADLNYVRSITETADQHAPLWVRILNHKARLGRVFSVHHHPEDNLHPMRSALLRQDGFMPLVGWTEPDIETFKAHNCQVLQRLLGLKEDPNARLMLWLNRFDYPQKGLGILLDCLPRLMMTYPKLQLVMAVNPCAHPVGQRVADRVLGRLKAMYPDRLALVPRAQQTNKAGLIAGCTYVLLPSLYEPFGITQLEAMRMGTLPVVHGVDGLLSSVLDPAMPMPLRIEDQRYYDNAHRPPLLYGQTGFMMPRLPVRAYQKAIQAFLRHPNALRREDQQVLKEAARSFYQVLTRAMAEPAEALPLLGLQAMRYVEDVHSWENLLSGYRQALDAAMHYHQLCAEATTAS